MRKRILIIGGNGYIGSRLEQFFWKNDIPSVTCWGNRHQDYNELDEKALGDFDYIILLAGHSSVASCDGPLRSSWNNNVRNFSNLIKKMQSGQKLIYASSASVYGNTGEKEVSECDCSMEYNNNYDLTKQTLDLFAEKELRFAYEKIIGLRFGVVNGGSPVLRQDLIINKMVFSALNENIIRVNNKNSFRPILGINDLCRAIHTIIESKIPISGIFNLASFNSSIDNIAKIVSEKLNVGIINYGDAENESSFAIDTTFFSSIYDFKFKDNVETIVDDLVYWYTKKQPRLVSRNSYFQYMK